MEVAAWGEGELAPGLSTALQWMLPMSRGRMVGLESFFLASLVLHTLQLDLIGGNVQ